MFRRGLRGFASCFLLSFATFALLSLPAIAQTLGQITGRITDASGAAVTGADVTLVNIATNATRSTVTTGDGDYTFASIPPGTYNVKAQHAGFRVAAANHIEVQVQQTVRQDLSLAVGQVNESVQVSASADLLQTENLAVGIEERTVSAELGTRMRTRVPSSGRAVTRSRSSTIIPGSSAFRASGRSRVSVATEPLRVRLTALTSGTPRRSSRGPARTRRRRCRGRARGVCRPGR